jgi:hypothetical protein
MNCKLVNLFMSWWQWHFKTAWLHGRVLMYCMVPCLYWVQYWASGFLSAQRFVEDFIILDTAGELNLAGGGAAAVSPMWGALTERQLNIQTFPSPGL